MRRVDANAVVEEPEQSPDGIAEKDLRSDAEANAE